MSKFRAPQPLELAAALKRIADRATILGTDLQFALIGHDGHPEVNELRDLSIHLGRKTYELAARLKREATTPPPPEEEKHPLFASPARRSGCYVALMGRNPLFWLAAIDPVQARKILDENRPDSSAWMLEEWNEETIQARQLPFFPVWSKANPLPDPDPKVPASTRRDPEPESPPLRQFVVVAGETPLFWVAMENAGPEETKSLRKDLGELFDDCTLVEMTEPGQLASYGELPAVYQVEKADAIRKARAGIHLAAVKQLEDDLGADRAKAKRPRPAKPEPGEKLGKRQCWIAKVAGKPAFRVYSHTEELAASQLAHLCIARDKWAEASLTLEFTNRSQDFNVVPMLSELVPEGARERVRQLLAEAEHESGSGFVAPMPEEPTAEAGDPVNSPATTWAAWHSDSGRWLFTVKAGNADEAREYCGMMLTDDQVDVLAFAPTDERHEGLPDWESFDLDAWPEPPAPSIPDYPTESPRDPLATLPIGELGLRKPTLDLLASRGIGTAGQLFDELDGDMLDGLLTEEQEGHVRGKILRWESERRSRIVADGSWLDEELTYAAFRIGDAPEFWARMREQGATDAELRDAINKRFFAMGGVDTQHRAGYRFVAGAAPAFYQGASKPKRDQEPALEGKHLVDAVRRLLAIPTREEPAAKAPAKRKAVKA